MTMTAKYNGRCSACGGSIRAGEQIDYGATTKARHPRCADGSAPKARSPSSAGGASDKQVGYALRLLGERGYSTRFVDRKFKGLGASMRQRSGTVRAWLEGMSGADVSALIDTRRE